MAAIQAAAQKAREDQENEPDEDNHEAVGQLPKPDFQRLHPDHIEWQWNPIIGKAHITSLYMKGSAYYTVSLYTTNENGELLLTGEEAKTLGEALISAWQWEHVWPAHAGEFLLNPDPPNENVPTEAPAEHVTRMSVPLPADFQVGKQHIGVDSSVHDGPAHPCNACDEMEKLGDVKRAVDD